ncbi:hypothetical protein [Clostridium sp. BJN0013]|uniref:hypothetical protein n=1 Tax=Clostridium sp. BJN0013 TaxID=3236840 RepID=UPI0034C61FF8
MNLIVNMKINISPWGFNRSWTPSKNISFNQYLISTYATDSGNLRLGLSYRDSNSVRLEGIGIDAVNSGYKQNNFYPCNLYVEYHKYLIKQSDKYFSMKDNVLIELSLPTDDIQKQQWFNNYGVDDLKNTLLTPDENGNKLIDSLNSQFEIRMMGAK